MRDLMKSFFFKEQVKNIEQIMESAIGQDVV